MLHNKFHGHLLIGSREEEHFPIFDIDIAVKGSMSAQGHHLNNHGNTRVFNTKFQGHRSTGSVK